MIKIIDYKNLDWKNEDNGNFSYSRKSLSQLAGNVALGSSIYKLEAGKKAFPYHFHYANEEAIFVIEGKGIVRTPEGELTITAGDYIAFPKGEDYAHQIINNSDTDLVYLCISTMLEPDIVEYPDSNKIAVMAGSAPGGAKEKRTLQTIYKKDNSIDYFKDEK